MQYIINKTQTYCRDWYINIFIFLYKYIHLYIYMYIYSLLCMKDGVRIRRYLETYCTLHRTVHRVQHGVHLQCICLIVIMFLLQICKMAQIHYSCLHRVALRCTYHKYITRRRITAQHCTLCTVLLLV